MILPILTAGTVRLCVKGLIGMREWRLRGLADEMQNSSIAEMHDFMTRVGYNGRIVIDGGRDGTERRDRSRDERPVAPAQSEQPPAKLAERRRGVGARPTAATERRDEKAATRREQQTAKSTEERRTEEYQMSKSSATSKIIQRGLGQQPIEDTRRTNQPQMRGLLGGWVLHPWISRLMWKGAM